MSTVFISHSSRDDCICRDIHARLTEWGYASVFLDFDPEAGIPAGRDWERDIYWHLRTCRALIALYTANSLTSHWCFAEIVRARELRKLIIPVKVGPCQI